MQVPTETKVAVAPDTVHTGAVVDAKATVSPDDAVALSVNGGLPIAMLAGAGKAMVWAAGVTLKLWSTGVAAL